MYRYTLKYIARVRVLFVPAAAAAAVTARARCGECLCKLITHHIIRCAAAGRQAGRQRTARRSARVKIGGGGAASAPSKRASKRTQRRRFSSSQRWLVKTSSPRRKRKHHKQPPQATTTHTYHNLSNILLCIYTHNIVNGFSVRADWRRLLKWRCLCNASKAKPRQPI